MGAFLPVKTVFALVNRWYIVRSTAHEKSSDPVQRGERRKSRSDHLSLIHILADFANFTLVEGDVMQQDLSALVRRHFSGLRPVLCANLPYNITTPFLTACVEAGCFESLTVLIQKEVAQRICAAPGTADYGAFTVLMQYYTQPELLLDVYKRQAYSLCVSVC